MLNLSDNDAEMLQKFADTFIGPKLQRNLARLYSQHTRLRAQGVGLPSWTEAERVHRLREAEKLLVVGLVTNDAGKKRQYLRRAGEVFEWAATGLPEADPTPVFLLASSAYQLAGYYARATGILSEHQLDGTTSEVLAAFLCADFPKAQQLLFQYWKNFHNQELPDSGNPQSIYLEQILRAMSIVVEWLRRGTEPRLDRAIRNLELSAKALRYDSDSYSWLLGLLFARISQKYKEDALWHSFAGVTKEMSELGHMALSNYARGAFLSKKILTWPSQQAGIRAINANNSFALCTPTGSGKTRVAEIAILKYLFGEANEFGSPPIVLYLAPSRALCAEVESTLSNSLCKTKAAISITSLYGGADFGATDITTFDEHPVVLICTHEKVDALIRFYGTHIFSRVTCVIIDEAHAVQFSGNNDEIIQANSRALRLEVLVGRLKSFCGARTKFIALSAVAAEIKEPLAQWVTDEVDTQPITADYRSTRQLFGKLLCEADGKTRLEYDVLDGQLFVVANENESPYVHDPFPPHPETGVVFKPTDSFATKSRAHLLWAAMHFSRHSDDGKHRPVLISVAAHPEYYAKTFLELLDGPWKSHELPHFFSRPTSGLRVDLFLKCLSSCEDYFGKNSREYRLLDKGIVLHHGKMPPVMSRLVIQLIKNQIVNIVVATSTLSEGVNLPFETVLIPSLSRYPDELTPSEVINIAGRAGRPGYSTEGKTLVLLPMHPKKKDHGQIRIYNSIVEVMASKNEKVTNEINSPLYALIDIIHKTWMKLSGSKDYTSFISWLENVAYTDINQKSVNLITSLDTLDQQILTVIEESEFLIPELSTEERLQIFWRKSLASLEKHSKQAETIFVKRGEALIQKIYPNQSHRKKLYQTSLPPRDGNTIIEILPQIMTHLKEAINFHVWSDEERLIHFNTLIEKISTVSTFEISDLKYTRSSIPWQNVLRWWMSPTSSHQLPNDSAVTAWYKYAADNFIYKLNWALGSILGLLLNESEETSLLKQWEECALPWVVLWYKDMLCWGTLDPVSSYILSQKAAFTRPDAKIIAHEYRNGISKFEDSDFKPTQIKKWLALRLPEEKKAQKHKRVRKIAATLLVDFSRSSINEGIYVWPTEGSANDIYWLDAAGYLIAKSPAPDDWQLVVGGSFDYFLKISSSVIRITRYV